MNSGDLQQEEVLTNSLTKYLFPTSAKLRKFTAQIRLQKDSTFSKVIHGSPSKTDIRMIYTTEHDIYEMNPVVSRNSVGKVRLNSSDGRLGFECDDACRWRAPH
jgi:hypothetical protein